VFELNDLNTNNIKEKFRFKNKKVKEIQETIGIHGMLVQNGRKLYLYIYIYIYIYIFGEWKKVYTYTIDKHWHHGDKKHELVYYADILWKFG